MMIIILNNLEVGNRTWKECKLEAENILNKFDNLGSNLENFNKYLKLSSGQAFLNALINLAKE